MSTTLVTAIYHSLREGKLGGRSWEEQYYFASLQNIINFGLPVVIFCDSKGEPKLTKYLKYLEYIGVENKWKIVVSELDDFKFAPMILKHRHAHCDYLYEENKKARLINPQTPLFFHTRCEVLCHRKLYFIKDVVDSNPFQTENFCWVDAGITHWGLTPFSRGGVEIFNFFDKKHYHPYNKNNIYTPDIGRGLDKIISNHNLFQFKHGNMWYSQLHIAAMKKLLITDYNLPSNIEITKQLVGGVIGIRDSEFKQLFEFYETALHLLCSEPPEATTFFTEEIILSAYYILRNHFTIDFIDWPHTVEGDPCFTDYGDQIEFKRKNLQFYQVWDIVKNHGIYS
jgi:hypothetical protein